MDRVGGARHLAAGQLTVPEGRLLSFLTLADALTNAKTYAAAQVAAGNGLTAVPEWVIKADPDYFTALVQEHSSLHIQV